MIAGVVECATQFKFLFSAKSKLAVCIGRQLGNCRLAAALLSWRTTEQTVREAVDEVRYGTDGSACRPSHCWRLSGSTASWGCIWCSAKCIVLLMWIDEGERSRHQTKFHLPNSCLPFSLSKAALSDATEAALAATYELLDEMEAATATGTEDTAGRESAPPLLLLLLLLNILVCTRGGCCCGSSWCCCCCCLEWLWLMWL